MTGQVCSVTDHDDGKTTIDYTVPGFDTDEEEITAVSEDVKGIKPSRSGFEYRDHPPAFNPGLKRSFDLIRDLSLDIYTMFFPAINIRGLVLRIIEDTREAADLRDRKGAYAAYRASQEEAGSSFRNLSRYCLQSNAPLMQQVFVGALDLSAWLHHTGREKEYREKFLDATHESSEVQWTFLLNLGKMKEKIRRGGRLTSRKADMYAFKVPDLMGMVYLFSIKRFGYEKERSIPFIHLSFSHVFHIKELILLFNEMRNIFEDESSENLLFAYPGIKLEESNMEPIKNIDLLYEMVAMYNAGYISQAEMDARMNVISHQKMRMHKALNTIFVYIEWMENVRKEVIHINRERRKGGGKQGKHRSTTPLPATIRADGVVEDGTIGSIVDPDHLRILKSLTADAEQVPMEIDQEIGEGGKTEAAGDGDPDPEPDTA